MSCLTRHWRILTLAAVWMCLLGCQREEGPAVGGIVAADGSPTDGAGEAIVEATKSVAKPAPPFEVAAPTAQPSKIDELDLTTYDSTTLSMLARTSAARNQYQQAHQLQYWSVRNDDEQAGRYNLACYACQDGDVEAAIYWLQLAAAKEGVDSDWAAEDPDLKKLWSDSRWPQLQTFLQQYNKYWQTSNHSETVLVVPSGYDGKQPLPVLIGLHGMGGRAKTFVTSVLQDLADRRQVAFVGVSGTSPVGPTSFHWAEDPAEDRKRIDAALAEVSDRLTIAKGQLITYGFSQGAMVAAEVASRDPDRFAGAILMSPGGNEMPQIGRVNASPKHARQGYVTLCGAKEQRGNVLITGHYAEKARALNARVHHHLYEGVEDHTLPPDFFEALSNWVDFILDPNAQALKKS